jgi:hypothetical protein
MDAEVFVYTGEGGVDVSRDVVRVRVDPSVTSIPVRAFFGHKKLTKVELCEGLVEIGERSFEWCDHSIKKINIPTSLRRINDRAFLRSLRAPILLHNGIESIGKNAFDCCIFTNFRVPPLITVIPNSMLAGCTTMFSLELPQNLSMIKEFALGGSYSLRNVAFPSNITLSGNIFIEDTFDDDEMHMHDLQRLFGRSNATIISELSHRFDRLKIHRFVYYQSYNHGVLRALRSMLDPTGNYQDCLGMTPLHILTCSYVHDIEVYRVIVENYPSNLITEDRWGALPLLYAFWGAAPDEIIQFLLDSYHSLYPGHVFNWTKMVDTMGRCDTPKESIENLLRVKQVHFPEQPIDWEYLLVVFASYSYFSYDMLEHHIKNACDF